MNSEDQSKVAIVGGDGEFGRFLRHDILPKLGVSNIFVIERESQRSAFSSLLEDARHIVLATPLAGYAELACEVVYHCRDLAGPTTLWLIPSVQAGVWRAVSATLELVANPQLYAVFVHPMYGPNGFRETEPEARTFQNILTATSSSGSQWLNDEIISLTELFVRQFNIKTTTSFNPEEHDRLTAYSQGLSYCVGRLMFERAEIDQAIHQELPDLHHSFTANHDLILDFLRINSYMPQVIAAFGHSWRHTRQATYTDVLQAFARADAALNRGSNSPISTKWYEKLRAAARAVP